MAKVGMEADFKQLVARTQCVTERHVRASRVTGYPSSQRACICGFCRAWPAHSICGVGKGNGPWRTTLEMMMMIARSCWWDKSKLSCSWKSKKWPWRAAVGASAPERVWCKRQFSSSKMQMGLESQYLICRYFSESFAVKFRRLNISSTDVYEQKWCNTEQWLSLNNLIHQLWNKLSALNSSVNRSNEPCSDFIGNFPYVDK